MGDGFKQVLALLIQLASGMFDVVWFDEIDTGLHFQSLSVLWHAVFAACKEFNVQLVATTHSYECVQAFAEAKNHEGDIALYRIDKTDGKHTAYRLSEEMVKVGIEKNFDVR
jgi:AAA15 family ATPase/GTPase